MGDPILGPPTEQNLMVDQNGEFFTQSIKESLVTLVDPNCAAIAKWSENVSYSCNIFSLKIHNFGWKRNRWPMRCVGKEKGEENAHFWLFDIFRHFWRTNEGSKLGDVPTWIHHWKRKTITVPWLMGRVRNRNNFSAEIVSRYLFLEARNRCNVPETENISRLCFSGVCQVF